MILDSISPEINPVEQTNKLPLNPDIVLGLNQIQGEIEGIQNRVNQSLKTNLSSVKMNPCLQKGFCKVNSPFPPNTLPPGTCLKSLEVEMITPNTAKGVSTASEQQSDCMWKTTYLASTYEEAKKIFETNSGCAATITRWNIIPCDIDPPTKPTQPTIPGIPQTPVLVPSQPVPIPFPAPVITPFPTPIDPTKPKPIDPIPDKGCCVPPIVNVEVKPVVECPKPPDVIVNNIIKCPTGPDKPCPDIGEMDFKNHLQWMVSKEGQEALKEYSKASGFDLTPFDTDKFFEGLKMLARTIKDKTTTVQTIGDLNPPLQRNEFLQLQASIR